MSRPYFQYYFLTYESSMPGFLRMYAPANITKTALVYTLTSMASWCHRLTSWSALRGMPPQQARWRRLLLLKEVRFYASMLFSVCRQATKCSPLLCFTSISLATILSAATLTPLKLRQQNGCRYSASVVTAESPYLSFATLK